MTKQSTLIMFVKHIRNQVWTEADLKHPKAFHKIDNSTPLYQKLLKLIIKKKLV